MSLRDTSYTVFVLFYLVKKTKLLYPFIIPTFRSWGHFFLYQLCMLLSSQIDRTRPVTEDCQGTGTGRGYETGVVPRKKKCNNDKRIDSSATTASVSAIPRIAAAQQQQQQREQQRRNDNSRWQQHKEATRQQQSQQERSRWNPSTCTLFQARRVYSFLPPLPHQKKQINDMKNKRNTKTNERLVKKQNLLKARGNSKTP